MVDRYGAPSNGKGWEAAQKKYDDCPRRKVRRESGIGKMCRLSEILNDDFYPPDYHAPIFVVRKDKTCWLSGLNSTPIQKVADEWHCMIDDKPVMLGRYGLHLHRRAK